VSGICIEVPGTQMQVPPLIRTGNGYEQCKGGTMPKRGVSGRLSSAVTAIIRASGFFASYVCLVGMLLLVISDPIMRYAVGSPIYWSNEVSTFLMVEMALCGFAIAFAKGKHVRVTLIFDRLSHKVKSVMWVVVSLLTLCFSGFLVYVVMRLAISSLESGAVSFTAELPLFPWQLVAALGLIVFFMTLLVFTVKRIAIAAGWMEEEEEGGELVETSF